MKIHELQKWYCLGNDGKIRYVGEFSSFDDADNALDDTAIWIVSEDSARQWLATLKELLENFMTTYNGHKNWNHWNVSLWITNDEGLYRMALEYIEQYPNKPEAAAQILADLKSSGVTHTPDGAPYSKTTILAAMRGFE